MTSNDMQDHFYKDVSDIQHSALLECKKIIQAKDAKILDLVEALDRSVSIHEELKEKGLLKNRGLVEIHEINKTLQKHRKD